MKLLDTPTIEEVGDLDGTDGDSQVTSGGDPGLGSNGSEVPEA